MALAPVFTNNSVFLQVFQIIDPKVCTTRINNWAQSETKFRINCFVNANFFLSGSRWIRNRWLLNIGSVVKGHLYVNLKYEARSISKSFC